MLLLWQSATPGKMQGSLLTKGFGCPTPVLTSTANLCGSVREQPRLTPQSSPKAPGSLGQPSWEMKVELPDTEKFAFCLPLSPTFMQDKDYLENIICKDKAHDRLKLVIHVLTFLFTSESNLSRLPRCLHSAWHVVCATHPAEPGPEAHSP